MFNRLTRVMLVALVIALVGAHPSWAALQGVPSESPWQQETPNDFSMNASGMVTTENALRYTVYVPKPLVDAENYVVQIEVPSDATVTQVLQGGESTFAGILSQATAEVTGQQLVWTVSNQAETDTPSTTLSFELSKPIDKPLIVTVNWDGERAGSLQKELIPRYSYNFSNVGQVVLGDSASAEFQRVGATGILIRAANGAIGGESTIITARALPPANDPEADEAGDFWWCSVLELSELAEGETVIVQMPLRRPLPPGTPVVLFQRQANDTWVPLDNPGVVTADGQAVEYEHPGGIVATGVDPSLQPQLADLTILTSEALAALLPSGGEISAVSSASTQHFAELPSYIQTAFAAAENLAGTPDNFAAASLDNAYSTQCSITADGESVCAYWVEVNQCTVAVNALPDVDVAPTVTCSNSAPPDGYPSACVMGEGPC